MIQEVSDIKIGILQGKMVVGIELGSTRIKSVLINEYHEVIAFGGYDWTNKYLDGIWTYDLNEVWIGIQQSYKSMVEDIKSKYDIELRNIASIGFSAMMHGYLVFDSDDQQLVPFKTWRNNITEKASKVLMELFEYPIPQRWSIAHLYEAFLNDEAHMNKVNYMTTLSGYVHWKLTGKKVLGVGDASGMFPIDLDTKSFNKRMIKQFDDSVKEKNYTWSLADILPQTLTAGEEAGRLTETGAKLIDPSGLLNSGILFCPPEGDAGTGMVATNSVAKRTGNVSAGTSIFAMVVLEKDLSKVYPELDLVTTPSGSLVAMAHSNNCTSDLDAWMGLFEETIHTFGMKIDKSTLYQKLYTKALEGDSDCGGLLSYGYLSGEHMTHFEEGRPLFVRTSESKFNLSNFMRVHLLTSLGAMKIGMDILLKEENVTLDKMFGHGGLFKTKGVGQRFMAASVNAPVTVMETAGEGGAWGIALLAAYMIAKEESLEAFLDQQVFSNQEGTTMMADKEDVLGFEKFMIRYKRCLPIERAAVDFL